MAIASGFVSALTDLQNQITPAPSVSTPAFNPISSSTAFDFLLNPNTDVGAVTNLSSIDDLVQRRTPQALSILGQGNQQQLAFQRQGLDDATAPLQALRDNRAFEEQRAILGLEGDQAQQQAIGNIPVSDFDQELIRRQRQQLLRQAAASGERGSGATLESAGRLAGVQQANIISNRLAQLEPAAALDRSLASAISKLSEAGLVNQAETQLGLGTQQANVRLGAVAPQIQTLQNQAELSGLNRIASANRQANLINQGASLLGGLFKPK